MLAYDVQANNKTPQPRAFYALYIRPNDEGTSYLVFKLSTKQTIITSDVVINVVSKMWKEEGMPNGIHFCILHKESILGDLYGDIDS